jgi:hypothetical protein
VSEGEQCASMKGKACPDVILGAASKVWVTS